MKEWWRSYRSHLSNEPFFVHRVRSEELGLMWCLTAAKSTPIKSMAVHPPPLSRENFKRRFCEEGGGENGWKIYIYTRTRYTDRILRFIKSVRRDRISVSVIRFLRNVWLFDLQIQKVTEIGVDDLFERRGEDRWMEKYGRNKVEVKDSCESEEEEVVREDVKVV